MTRAITPTSTSSTSGDECTSSKPAAPISSAPTSGVTFTASSTPMSNIKSTCAPFSTVMINGSTGSTAPKAGGPTSSIAPKGGCTGYVTSGPRM